MPSIDTLSLTSSQRDALEQLRAITNTNPGGYDKSKNEIDEKVQNEIAVLESVNWDVERAANAIFSQPPVSLASGISILDNTHSNSKTSFESFQIDDVAQNRSNISSRAPSAQAFPIRIFLGLVSIASFPLTLIFNIVSNLFRLLHIPVPRAPGLSLNFVGLRNSLWMVTRTGTNHLKRIPDDPFLAAERFVRDLEEETGAITVSRARASTAESSNIAGPSSAPIPLNPDPNRVLLPDFHLGSYESALQLARRDARPLCAILLSDEHDDTPAFKRDVLTNPEFVRVLTEGEFIVWAGDIRGADGYQASLKLTATTYPFVAFIGLQPRLPSRSQLNSTVSSHTSLTVLSRQPSSTIPAPLSSLALSAHISTTIIPRITPLRLQALARAEERRLREEQDAAFQASERADAERILKRRKEEERTQQLMQIEQERANKADEEARAMAREDELYKKWLGSSIVHINPEPSNGAGIRIGLRMPDGRRSIRRFSASDEVTNIYIWAGAMLYNVTEGNSIDERYEPTHKFSLAVAFPRSEVPCIRHQKIGEVDALKGGANLVIEGFTGHGQSINDSDSDNE